MVVTESSELRKKKIRYVVMVVVQCDKTKSPIYGCVIHVYVTNSRSRRHIPKAWHTRTLPTSRRTATNCNSTVNSMLLQLPKAVVSTAAHCNKLLHTTPKHTIHLALLQLSKAVVPHRNTLQHTVNLARLQFPEAVAAGA